MGSIINQESEEIPMNSKFTSLVLAGLLVGLSAHAAKPLFDPDDWTETPVVAFRHPIYLNLKELEIRGDLVAFWAAMMDDREKRFLNKVSVNCDTHKSVIVRVISLDGPFKETGTASIDFPLGKIPKTSKVGTVDYTMQQFVCGVVSVLKQKNEQTDADAEPEPR